MAIVIEATHTDYEKIKHLSKMVDDVIDGEDHTQEYPVLLKVQEILSDALIMEVE